MTVTICGNRAKIVSFLSYLESLIKNGGKIGEQPRVVLREKSIGPLTWNKKKDFHRLASFPRRRKRWNKEQEDTLLMKETGEGERTGWTLWVLLEVRHSPSFSVLSIYHEELGERQKELRASSGFSRDLESESESTRLRDVPIAILVDEAVNNICGIIKYWNFFVVKELSE